ncbi:hypothetical protein C0Q70_03712 [Pomacea canaliculata]|uniref:Uncharacterized protein n=1 Tax=Pomacea canaliculata TaxID=400727 RepID=A0A2T7PTH4_POMCA|nr:hypothetical protein C0Q70_03712 [Pomacea canaliculata]
MFWTTMNSWIMRVEWRGLRMPLAMRSPRCTERAWSLENTDEIDEMIGDVYQLFSRSHVTASPRETLKTTSPVRRQSPETSSFASLPERDYTCHFRSASSMLKPESGERLENETIISRPTDQRLLLQWPSEGQVWLRFTVAVGAIQSKDVTSSYSHFRKISPANFPFCTCCLRGQINRRSASSLGDNFVDVSKDEVNKIEDEDANNEKVKRSVRDRKVTIEVGVYLDRLFLNKVWEKHQISSNQQLTDFIARKWSGIAGVLHNPSLVGWDITIKVVNVEIWRSNPWWYQDSTKDLGKRLRMASTNTMNQPFDYISFETADAEPPGKMGLAHVGGMCNPRNRVGITKGANYNFAPEIHEMGHAYVFLFDCG